MRGVALKTQLDAPPSRLRATTLGEMVATWIAFQGVFGALAWGWHLVAYPAGLLFVVCGIWLSVRATGWGAGRATIPVVSGGLIALVLLLDQQSLPDLPRWLTHGPVSPPVWIIMLCIILVTDLLDIAALPALRNAWTRTVRRPSCDTVDTSTSPGIRVSGSHTRNRLSWTWKQVAVLLSAGGLILYLFLIPVIEITWERYIQPAPAVRILEDITLSELVRLRVCELVSGCLFLAFGATVGSFLNVVAYRLPRGQTLIWQRSRCPVCGTQIEGRDNIPILGWLLLKGCCRSCGCEISPRYPSVEAVTGLIFLLLYFAELLSGGANLAQRVPNTYTGVVWILFYTKWDLVRLYLFHCALLSTLLAWVLIDADGHRVPYRAMVTTIVLALLAIACFPDLLLVSPMPPQPPFWKPTRIEALQAGLIGGMAGWLGGTMMSLCLTGCRDTNWKTSNSNLSSSMLLAGLVMGWQAVLSIGLLMVLLRTVQLIFASWRPAIARWPLSGLLLAATLLQLLIWRFTSTHWSSWWPGPNSTGLQSLAVVILCGTAGTVLCWFSVASRHASSNDEVMPADDAVPFPSDRVSHQ